MAPIGVPCCLYILGTTCTYGSYNELLGHKGDGKVSQEAGLMVALPEIPPPGMLKPVGTVAGCWLECAAGAGVSVTETPLPTTPRAAAAAAAADADGGTEPEGMDCGRNTGGCAEGEREAMMLLRFALPNGRRTQY